MLQQERIILIGAGNVAHHLAAVWLRAGLTICQIYSRTMESARGLGAKTGIAYTDEISQIYPDGDIYLFAVSDDALPSLLKAIRLKGDPLLVHTSGSQPLSLLTPYSARCGVLYPLQTFSRDCEPDFRTVPLCIEANQPAALKQLYRLAEALEGRVMEIDTKRRRVLHLAAVFACNFPNALYRMAGEILDEQGLEFSLLRPLIRETAGKVMTLLPEEAQTGPARRGDESILNRHKTLLKKKPALQQVYSLLSEMIEEHYRTPQQPDPEEPAAPPAVPEMPTLW